MFNYNYPMSTPNYSLSDIAAASGNGYRNNDGGMWGDGAWWIIILFLFCFNGWAVMAGVIMVLMVLVFKALQPEKKSVMALT